MDNAYANISSNFEEKGDQNQVNEGTKSDSFVVDMQHFSRISVSFSNLKKCFWDSTIFKQVKAFCYQTLAFSA